MPYLAHSATPEHPDGQPLAEHLRAVAAYAAAFATPFGASEIAKKAGMLHDIGKYAAAFQAHLQGDKRPVDHSTAGALEAMCANEQPGDVPKLNVQNAPIAFCISGHHAGLPDLGNRRTALAEDGTFWGKLKRRPGVEIEEYDAFRREIRIPSAVPPVFRDPVAGYFYIKMLYSCLVDADWLDTERYFANGAVQRGGYAPLEDLRCKLDAHITRWQNPTRPIDQKRCEILKTLMERSALSRGLFTLTVPTGGGKTVSSMAFALRHALTHGLRRVLYVIPYCSILEQTQSVFEDIFGAENVVAHYANVEYADKKDELETDRRALSCENWDAPIILTTAVQFFESLYSNRPSRCRKLHNIAESVIIFDEAQMLPPPLLRPCLTAIAALVREYRCSAVLCTATQPALSPLLQALMPEYPPRELCPDPKGMYAFFRRVCYRQDGMLSDEALAEALAAERRVLCIVNSRRQAQNLYHLLDKSDSFHLSTTMTANDRRAVLKEIRARLDDGRPCRIVSTSLIEAGVDVSFPTVYRSLSGLDSIVQAGGRCNREGKDAAEDSIVHIFRTESRQPAALDQNIAAAEHALRSGLDPASPEAIEAYFHFLLYVLKGPEALDKLEIAKKIQTLSFAEIGSKFHLIEDAGYTIYIPQGEAQPLTKTLLTGSYDRTQLRRLGPYAIAVYANHFRNLVRAGAAQLVPGTANAAVLTDESLYSPETGLAFDVEEGKSLFA